MAIKKVNLTPKSGVFRVSHSKIKQWLKCKYSYHLKYVEKLKARKKSRPLQFGGMVHDMLEAYINGDDPFEKLEEIAKKQGKLFRAEIDEYGDIVADVRVIMTEYFKHWGEKSVVFVRKNKKAAEHKFEVELMDGVVLVGKIDAIGKAKGLRWMVEHKTFTQMPNDDHRWKNVQSGVYLRVNDMLGWEQLDGTLWDYIHSKSPSMPQILKSGEISRKAINTLPTRIEEMIEDHGLDRAKFAGMLKLAKENRNHYFQRIFNPKKKKVLDALWGDLISTVEEMVEFHGKSKTRTIDRHCDWCDYEPICRAALQGQDVDYVKEKQFYVDQEDHSHEWEDAATA